MKIIVLIENSPNPGPSSGLVSEHGLSLYVESEGRRLIADAGASDAVWSNAERLGVDWTTVPTLTVSHGHYDHTGGVPTFARRNPSARIYMRREATGDFWHVEPGDERYLGIPREILAAPGLRLLDGNAEIAPGVALFGNVERRVKTRGDAFLMRRAASGEWTPDDFDHEQNLVVEERGRRFLFAGCAHAGILNILARFYERYGAYPEGVVGGLHLRCKRGYSPEDEREILETAQALKETGAVFYTGHCTGERPCELLESVLGTNLRRLHTGLIVEI